MSQEINRTTEYVATEKMPSCPSKTYCPNNISCFLSSLIQYFPVVIYIEPWVWATTYHQCHPHIIH